MTGSNLHRRSREGQEKIVVGSPIPTRKRSAMEAETKRARNDANVTDVQGRAQRRSRTGSGKEAKAKS